MPVLSRHSSATSCNDTDIHWVNRAWIVGQWIDGSHSASEPRPQVAQPASNHRLPGDGRSKSPELIDVVVLMVAVAKRTHLQVGKRRRLLSHQTWFLSANSFGWGFK